jgi:hypothetical protein
VALEVGSVVARLGAKLDDDAFDRFDRRLEGARKDAHRPVEVALRGDAEKRGFDQFDRHVDQAKRKAKPIEVPLGSRTDTTGFDRYNRRLKGAEADTAAASGRIRASVGKIGPAAAAGLALGAAGIFQVGKALADAGSDIQESLGKNRVLFGQFAGDVDKFSRQSASSFGISRKAALEYAGTFGNLARAIGIPQKAAAETSVKLTKLGADLASFNNTSVEDALDALRSGLVGETEPLRRFGITLSANAVAAEAMRQGIVKTSKSSLEFREASLKVEQAQKAQNAAIREHGKDSMEARAASIGLEKANRELTKTAAGGKVELTAQQKALATTSLIFKQSKNAVGDFARTSSGAANQQRILSARIDDAKAAVGTALVGALKKGTVGLNGLIDAGADVVKWCKDAIHFLKGTSGQAVALEAAAAALAVPLGLVAANLALVRARLVAMAIIGTVTTAVSRARNAWIALNLVIAANPVAAFLIALTALGAGLSVAYKRSDTFRAGVQTAFRAIERAAGTMADKVLGVLTGLMGGYSSALSALGHVPGFGWAKDAAKAIDKTRDALDGMRESVRDLGKEEDKQQSAADRHRKRVDALKTRLEFLDKGTSAYKSTARELRREQDKLTDALRDAQPAGERAGRGLKSAGDAAKNAGGAASRSGAQIAKSFNALATQFGIAPVKYEFADVARGSTHATGGVVGTSGGRFAGGGIPNAGAASADDHTLVDPAGRPIARLSGSEGIINRPQMGIVDHALRVAAAVGESAYDGLGALWSSGMRHYAGGGILGRAAALDRMHLPYVWGGHHGDQGPIRDPRPGLDCSSAVSYVLGIPPRVSGALETIGKPGPGRVTIYANPTHTFMSINGRGFGTSAENPGGGPGWLSYNSRPGFVVRHVDGDVGMADGGNVTASRIAGPGRMGDLLRRSAARLAAGANRKLTSAMGAFDSPGGQPLAEGPSTKAMLRGLWGRHGGSSSSANVAAAVALAESGGNPNAKNLNTNGTIDRGLWQINSIHGARSTFDPGKNADGAVAISSGGRNWRPWVTYNTGAYRKFLATGGLFPGAAGLGSRIAAAGRAAVTPVRGLTRMQSDRSHEYDELVGRVGTLNTQYSIADRRYGLSEEELVDADGNVDPKAVAKRAAELEGLRRYRKRILEALRAAKLVADRYIKTYRETIARLTRSLKATKGKKKRAGVEHTIATYQGRITEWGQKRRELTTDTIPNARLDYDELTKERLGVLGTKSTAEPAGGDPIGDLDDISSVGDPGAGGTPDAGDTSTTTSTPAAPDPAEVAAQALAQVGAFQAARADLFSSYGSNYTGPLGSVGAPFSSPLAQAAGSRYFGAEKGDPDAGGARVVQNLYFTGPQPADPHVFTQTALHEAEAAL